MNEQTNNSINPNPLPPELQMYLRDAHAAEEAALDAELPEIGDEIIRIAQEDYDPAITLLGETAADEAEQQIADSWSTFKVQIQDIEKSQHDIADTAPRVLAAKEAAIAAFPREVTEAGEDLRPGEQPADDDNFTEIDRYLDNPEPIEGLISSSDHSKNENASTDKDTGDGNAESDFRGRDKIAAGFLNSIGAESDGRPYNEVLSPWPTLSQTAEMQRLTTEADADIAILRGFYVRNVVAGNPIDGLAAHLWTEWAKRYPILLRDSNDPPKIIRDENGRVSGVDFTIPENNKKNN